MKAEKSYYQAVEIFDSFSKGDECDNRDLCIDIIELYINEFGYDKVNSLFQKYCSGEVNERWEKITALLSQ